MAIIDHFREQQKKLPQNKSYKPHKHNPDMLLIGCIDARLNPRDDIGIPRGRALIYRNIAATIPPRSDETADKEAALTYAIKEKGVKHLAIMGHTCCGGMHACLCGISDDLPAVKKHLEPFEQARAGVIAKGGDLEQQERAMEQATVRQSVANLMTYPVVAEAVHAGKLQLHGWVINTATKRIKEMDPETKEFAPMKVRTTFPAPKKNGTVKRDVIELVRYRQQKASDEDLLPPPQHPEMLILSDMDARVNPAHDMKIPYGRVLIHRDLDPCGPDARVSQEAALEFAIKSGVKHVTLMLHTDSDQYKAASPEEERRAEEAALRAGIKKIKGYKVVEEALGAGKIKLHGWLIDTFNRHISEMDLSSGQFQSMGNLTSQSAAKY